MREIVVDVMPNVDFYLKKQILKDRTRYFSPIWSNRIYGEYYHINLGMEATGQREEKIMVGRNER